MLNGQEWLADQEKTKENDWVAIDGNTIDRGDMEIRNTEEDAIYRLERHSTAGYTFNVNNGTYTVKLHFAETYASNQFPGARLFNANIEGGKKLQDFDIYKEAGGFRTALVKTFEGIKVEDGSLDIEFDPPNQAAINGIEVIKN